jgi:hypothetical protein
MTRPKAMALIGLYIQHKRKIRDTKNHSSWASLPLHMTEAARVMVTCCDDCTGSVDLDC